MERESLPAVCGEREEQSSLTVGNAALLRLNSESPVVGLRIGRMLPSSTKVRMQGGSTGAQASLELHRVELVLVDQVLGGTVGEPAGRDAAHLGDSLEARRGVDDVAGDHALARLGMSREVDQASPMLTAALIRVSSAQGIRTLRSDFGPSLQGLSFSAPGWGGVGTQATIGPYLRAQCSATASFSAQNKRPLGCPLIPFSGITDQSGSDF
jgi:hypothetical protein